MGQIKNIKLHIVTDIKVWIDFWILHLPETFSNQTKTNKQNVRRSSSCSNGSVSRGGGRTNNVHGMCVDERRSGELYSRERRSQLWWTSRSSQPMHGTTYDRVVSMEILDSAHWVRG